MKKLTLSVLLLSAAAQAKSADQLARECKKLNPTFRQEVLVTSGFYKGFRGFITEFPGLDLRVTIYDGNLITLVTNATIECSEVTKVN